MEQPTGMAAEQLGALDRLKSLPSLARFYLAGGAAVAYHLRHRSSLDLDLFSESPQADLEAVREAVVSTFGDTETLAITDAAVRFRVGDCPLDVVRYPYPLLAPPTPGPAGFPVAGLPDLAAMKLTTIARRGLRRDFWDLHAILASGMTLRDAADAYLRRFGLRESDLYHVLRSLTYFEDAEKEPVLPAGLDAAKWGAIKAYFVREAPKLLEEP